ncbi:helix-turn-helix domain-containing protein [Lactiplantibacillus pentosus]|uniref:helix-turn-helix domain-containing protein n=1 Tax=Lactiplantibacillus pentosus TaxID=1589 RepID=UPI0021825612|nr:helix-turn-helix transcriptional regulator [Lactiplantibacillus pentosus]MCT0163043.1 transcriptional regulator [Lactiplantibacillus pentosus]
MIKITLNVVMAERNITTSELAMRVGITPTNISILKTGKAKAIRFSTLEKICAVLECQPGDIISYVDDN